MHQKGSRQTSSMIEILGKGSCLWTGSFLLTCLLGLVIAGRISIQITNTSPAYLWTCNRARQETGFAGFLSHVIMARYSTMTLWIMSYHLQKYFCLCSMKYCKYCQIKTLLWKEGIFSSGPAPTNTRVKACDYFWVEVKPPGAACSPLVSWDTELMRQWVTACYPQAHACRWLQIWERTPLIWTTSIAWH